MKPFFSVIIPTFNQGDLLLRCIKSVLNQSFKNFEIIIIDNNSSDNTKKIIRKFKNKIIYKKINNKGVIAKSRNLGIRIAKGKWVSFLDSDDEWFKDKLKITYKQIKKNNFDVICNDEWIISKKKIRIWSNGPNQLKLYRNMLKFGNIMSTSASSVRKDFLTNKKIIFNEKKKFITSEDYDFFLNLALKKGNFFFIPIPLGFHYSHGDSASSNKKKHKNSIYEVLKHHSYNLQKLNLDKKRFFLSCKSNLDFKYDLMDIVNQRKIINVKIIEILKSFFNNPIEIFYFSFILTKKKIINSFRSYKFKKSLPKLKV